MRSQGPAPSLTKAYSHSPFANDEYDAKKAQELESPFMATGPLGGAGGEPALPLSSSVAAPQVADRGLLELKIKLKYGEELHVLELGAHKSRAVSEILGRVQKWFNTEVLVRDQKGEAGGPSSSLDDFRLLNGSTCLRRERRLEDEGVTKDCELQARYLAGAPESAPRQPEEAEEEQIDLSRPVEAQKDNVLAAIKEKCDPNLLPKGAGPGYKTMPTLAELGEKTDQELRSLPSFTVSNVHGSIEFRPRDGRGVDVTEVDLADVQILPREVIVYGRFEKNEAGKPAIGTKLNVPAAITLKNVSPPAGTPPAEWERRLKSNLARSSIRNAEEGDDGAAVFVTYDPESHDWTFTVPHFTKWGVGGDEEKEESHE